MWKCVLLNVEKTKKMVIDSRRKVTTPRPLRILAKYLELVDVYKYCGMTIDNQLNWSANSTAAYKKSCSRL